MLNKNKWRIVLSSVIILLPILFGLIMWNKLPAVMTTHWGADGTADGFASKAFAVFGAPAILLLMHLICLGFTLLDSRQKEQNQKALGMVFWIVPTLSLLVNGVMYRTALGHALDLTLLAPLLLSATFLFMGNYLPKIKQNRTIGIKLWWTFCNEENWNRTHRFGGKVWVACGLVLLCGVCLPPKSMIVLLLPVIIIAVISPIVCSYCIYRQHRRAGIAYAAMPKSKADKRAARISAVIVPLILAGVAVLMFTGDIDVRCENTAFEIEASYWSDSTVAYAEIDTIAYRNDLDMGVRTNGLGSARLSLGIFQNDEFGAYTLYAYRNAEAHIVLTADEKTLVIGLDDADDTRALYEELSERIGK